MTVADIIAKLRAEYGNRPPGVVMLEALERLATDEERAELEAAFIAETDNSPRPQDGPQS